MPLSTFDATLHNASMKGYEGQLRAVADHIVPASYATPGATGSGAFDYLWKQLSPGGDLENHWKNYSNALWQISDLSEAHYNLNQFTDLDDFDKDAVLRLFEKQNPRFFARMVEHVQEGFYTSQAAFDMIGWKVTA